MATTAARAKKLKGVLKGPSESINISDLFGGLDQGASRWRMNPTRLKTSQNILTDERPGVMLKRPGAIADTDAATGTTENLGNFIKSDGTETLVRSYHSSTNTYLEKRNADGTWSQIYYTAAGGTADVTGGTTITLTTIGYDDSDSILYTDVYAMTTEAVVVGGVVGANRISLNLTLGL